MTFRRPSRGAIKSAFIGGVCLALGQLIFDHDSPLCFHWSCIKHYIWILFAGGARSAWEFLKDPESGKGQSNGGTEGGNGKAGTAAASN